MDRQEKKYLKDKEFTQGHFWARKRLIFSWAASLCVSVNEFHLHFHKKAYFTLAIKKHPYSESNTNFIVTFGFDLGSVLLCL